jgi:hypothetical protein
VNLSETARALALVQAFDQRTVGDADVIAWQGVLSDAALADVEAAVRQHYAEETTRIMPAHIRRAVRDMIAQREAAARATPWAPGQYGVRKEEAVPEVTTGERLALSDLPAAVAELVARVRADLPDGSREALMPRTVAWEREHRAFTRVHNGTPNPLYRPRAAGSLHDPMPDRDDPALEGWLKARGWASYDEWAARGGPLAHLNCAHDPGRDPEAVTVTCPDA